MNNTYTINMINTLNSLGKEIEIQIIYKKYIYTYCVRLL